MARYGGRSRKNKRRVFIISALLVVALILVIIYKPLDKDVQQDQSESSVEESGEVQQVEIIAEVELPKIVVDLAEEPNVQASELIKTAMELADGEPARIIEARDILNEVLPMSMSARQRGYAKEQLSKLAERWLFSETVIPGDSLCGSYKVQPGDLLMNIAKKYKVPYEILMEINNISQPQSLKAGETIKVVNGPFHVRVYRSTFTMDLYLQNTFVKSFTVGLGRENRETPTGLWVVEPSGKLIKPTWTDPDTGKTYEAENPDYPLGSRWIGLKGLKGDAVGRTGFAFHGTKDPNLIGSAGSRGCIRLHNGDVVFVYNVLEPGYSRVEVVE